MLLRKTRISSLQEFDKVRQAWSRRFKNRKKGPTVAEIEHAIELVGEVDLDNCIVMKRFINVIRANRIAQEFQMCYWSNAPGRPFLYLGTTAGLPTQEAVEATRDQNDYDGTIYVAATQPSWRIVWRFE